MSGTSTLVARTPRVEDIVAADLATMETKREGENKFAERRTAALHEVELLGETWAHGSGSLTRAAWKFAAGVADKTFAQENAGVVYLAVVKGFNRAAKRDKLGVTELKDKPDDIGSVVSIFGTFGLRGPVAQGLGLYKRVIQIHAGITAENVQSAYNCMVTVNRRVQAATKDIVELEKVAAFKVTDEMIREWITPKPKADKTELQKLDAAIAQIAKLVKTELYPALDQQLASLERFRAKHVENLAKQAARATKEAADEEAELIKAEVAAATVQ